MGRFTLLLLALASVYLSCARVEVIPGEGLPSLRELGLTSVQLFFKGAGVRK